MKELLTFPEKDYTAEGSYNEEFHGRAFDELILSADFNVAATGSNVTPHDRGALKLLGTPELNQAQNTLVRANAIDLWHGAAFFNGAHPELDQPASITAGSDSDTNTGIRIKLPRIIPGMMVNASVTKAFLRGNFGTLASYASVNPSSVSAITGKLRGAVVSTKRNARAGFLRPRITQAELLLETAGVHQHVIRFEQDTYVRAFELRAFDSSADADVDGLIRGVKAFVTDANGTNDVVRCRWGHLRRHTQALAGWNKEEVDRSKGVVFVTMTDEGAAGVAGAKLFKSGDSITFEFDTSLTVEKNYPAVTPASGDKVFITQWAATVVAGQGDAGPSVRTIANPKAARRRARNLRRQGRLNR